jgi:hypothetical protein
MPVTLFKNREIETQYLLSVQKRKVKKTKVDKIALQCANPRLLTAISALLVVLTKKKEEKII